MELRLTGYKNMASKKATRVDIAQQHNLKQMLVQAVCDISDAEFDAMLTKLTRFVASSKCEHQAVYFWIEK